MAHLAGPDYVGVMSFTVSDRALDRVAEIVAAEGRTAALRVAVLAGGCSGFQYKFDLDAALKEKIGVAARELLAWNDAA